MTTKAHKLLSGADLHEPKGIETATSGQVYKADGLGSGSWQTIVVPTGLFNLSYAVFSSSGTWTKPTNFFMARVICIGAGGGDTGAGGTTSFGSYCSASGGTIVSTGTGGAGLIGDLLLDGDSTHSSTSTATVAYGGYPGLIYGKYGRGYLDESGNVAGAGGGAAIKMLYTATSTVTVTVGAAGTTSGLMKPAQSGIVIVEQYTTV